MVFHGQNHRGTYDKTTAGTQTLAGGDPSMLPNDPLKIPLARQPVQSAAVSFDVIKVSSAGVRTFPARDHTANLRLRSSRRTGSQVLAGGPAMARMPQFFPSVFRWWLDMVKDEYLDRRGLPRELKSQHAQQVTERRTIRICQHRFLVPLTVSDGGLCGARRTEVLPPADFDFVEIREAGPIQDQTIRETGHVLCKVRDTDSLSLDSFDWTTPENMTCVRIASIDIPGSLFLDSCFLEF